MAALHFDQGKQAQALDEYIQLVLDYPTRTTLLWKLGLRQAKAGRFEQSLSTIERVIPLMGPNATDEIALLGYLHGRLGQRDRALVTLAKLDRMEKAGDYVSPLIRSWPHIGLGDFDAALVWMERAVNEKEPWLVYADGFAPFDPIRSNPRFDQLIRLAVPRVDF